MQHPEEGTIHTWLDGELPADEAATLEAHVAECSKCATTVAEARGLIAASSRIISSLDSVPGGVIPARTPVRGRWYSTVQFRAAAALLLVAGTSLVLLRNGRESATATLATKPRTVIASGTASREIAAAKAPAPAPTVPQAPAQSIATGAAVPKTTAHVNAASPLSRTDQPVAPAKVEAPQLAPRAAEPRNAVTETMSEGIAADEARIADNSQLRIVRSDTTGSTTRTVYETITGTRVTLVEMAPPGFAAPIAPRPASASARGATTGVSPLLQKAATRDRPATVPAVVNESAKAPAHTILWSDPATGRTYSLTGSLTVAQLESLKAAIVTSKH